MAVDSNGLGIFSAVGLPLEVVGGPVGLLKRSWLLKGFNVWVACFVPLDFFFLTHVLHLDKKGGNERNLNWRGACPEGI